jgi:hypothetical protein
LFRQTYLGYIVSLDSAFEMCGGVASGGGT